MEARVCDERPYGKGYEEPIKDTKETIRRIRRESPSGRNWRMETVPIHGEDPKDCHRSYIKKIQKIYRFDVILHYYNP